MACYLRVMNEIALRDQIVAAWSDRSLLQQDSVRDAVAEVMRALTKGVEVATRARRFVESQ